MMSLAPGGISRRFFTAVGLETPSQTVTLSRWRSAKEYSDGSVLSRYCEDIDTHLCGLKLPILHDAWPDYFFFAEISCDIFRRFWECSMRNESRLSFVSSLFA